MELLDNSGYSIILYHHTLQDAMKMSSQLMVPFLAGWKSLYIPDKTPPGPLPLQEAWGASFEDSSGTDQT